MAHAWVRFQRRLLVMAILAVLVVAGGIAFLVRLGPAQPTREMQPTAAPSRGPSRSASTADGSSQPAPAWLPEGSYEAVRRQLEPLVHRGQATAQQALALTYLNQELGRIASARRALERVPQEGLTAEDSAYQQLFLGRQAVLEGDSEQAIVQALTVADGPVRHRPEGRWLLAKAAEMALAREEFEVALSLTRTLFPQDPPSLHVSAVRARAATGRLAEAREILQREAAAFPPIERALALVEVELLAKDPAAVRGAWDEAYDLVLEEQRREHVPRLLRQAWRAGEDERLALAVMTWEEDLNRLPMAEAELTGILLTLVRAGSTSHAVSVARVIAERDPADWSRRHNVAYLVLLVEGATSALASEAEELWRSQPQRTAAAATAILAAARMGQKERAQAIFAAMAPTAWLQASPGTRAVVGWWLSTQGKVAEARAMVEGIMPEGLLREEAVLLEQVWQTP